MARRPMSPEEEPAKPPEGEPESWPDTLSFWVALTFAAIAVPVFICGGGVQLLRRLF